MASAEDPLLKRIAELEKENAELKNQAFLGNAGATYRSLLEYSPVPLWISRDNLIVFANSAAVRLVGASGSEDLLGRPPLDFIHPDFHEIVEIRRKLVTESGRLVPPIEESIVRLDGGVVDVDVTTRAFPFEGGTAVIANFVDLTERKRWEQAVRISRERLDLVMSTVELGLFYCDLPFDRLIWNERCKQHFGLPADAEVTIDTFYERLHPEDRARTKEAIEGNIAGHGGYDIQYRTIGLDDIVRWIRAIGRCFYGPDGEPKRFDGVTVDITEQKAVEEALRQNEERYRALLKREESARKTAEMLNRVGPMLAAELDLGKLVQVVTDIARAVTNAEYAAFFYNVTGEDGARYMLHTVSGVPREAFKDFPIPRATELFAPTFRGEGIVRIADVQEDPRYGKNPPYSGMPLGHLGVVSYLAAPVVSRLGDVIGGLFFAHTSAGAFTLEHEHMAAGISAQAAIAMDNARLFDQMNRERDRAETAQQALAATNAELQQFAYVASHDLQEPLRTISSFTQLLEKRLGGIIDENSAEFMGYIVGGAQRMSEVIQDLLAYSRLQNTTPAPLGPVSMNEVMRQTMDSCRATIEESGVEITFEDLPEVSGDDVQLIQVLQNLIANAIKYRGQAAPRIHVSVERDGEHWRFGVRDNGIGIDRQYHERIFGIFKRLHGKEVPGTGIGLAICKRIVEQHGGHISVESRCGEGSTFYFTLRAA